MDSSNQQKGPIYVCALGGESPLSQITRVRQGLAQLPRVILCDDITQADLVYANDAGCFDNVLQFKHSLKPTACIIFNVLDIPVHLIPPIGDYTFEKIAKLGTQLAQADKITCISKFVQGQIQQYLGLPSYVIYNPIKNVSPNKRLNGEKPYPYKVLMAGRLNDSNKRARSLSIPSLIMAGYEEKDVAVVGGEYPGWGTNLGVVSDETLNDLYNSVDFVMAPSMLEGLGLVPLEGMICGAVPILCSDMTTISEFPYPRFWWCHPSPQSISYHLRVRIENPHVMEADRDYCLSVGESLAEELNSVAVARRILNAYDNGNPF